MPSLAIVIPVFNDWEGIPTLISQLEYHLADTQCIDNAVVLLVDDGSTARSIPTFPRNQSVLRRLEIIKVGCNLGHQRAIAIGLCEVVNRSSFDLVLILDSDGEDSPSDVGRLVSAWMKTPSSVVVARRGNRHEGLIFQYSYFLYLTLFQTLTGRRLDFGNFALLSTTSATRLVHMPELWNHFAASVLRSRIHVNGIYINKSRRLHGNSKMNYVSLVNHGLSAASVLVDVVFARLLILTTACGVLTSGIVSYILYLKLFTTYAIPGWASTMIGFALIVLIQILTILFVVTFLILASRSGFKRPTLSQAREYVRSIQTYDLS